ncbi:MAG TPA: alpha/beta hydrolase [Candidatus Dormibacteraeota bacterium]|nr:alpha/beta hydrolase [Candidatus Dormibacteraeota bacterium]
MEAAIDLRSDVTQMTEGRPAVGAQPGCGVISVDGVELAYDDEGRGETVVCLHAIGHGAGDFAGFRGRHRDRYRVIALDWPDQGRSAADRVPPSSARYGELLAGALDGLGLERPVLLGNSIGGAAALRVAATHPDRVRAVVACNPGGLVAHGLRKRFFTAAVARFFARGARGGRWTRRAFAAMYRGILSEPPAAEQRARIVATWPEVAPLLAAAWRSFGQPDDDLTSLLPGIACPVLVTWSTGDRLNPLAFNRPGIARLAHGELATFRGGHSPFLECPQAFDDVFRRFMETRA